MPRSILSASSWLLVVVPLLTASAAAPRPKPGTAAGKQEDPKAAARVLFEYAQREYDLGNFEDALGGYSEAYRLMPAPALLFNIGQCHRQLGQYERAAFFYRRYLALEPDSPDAALVKDLIQTMEAKQAALEPAPSGTPVTPAPGELTVPLTPEATPAVKASSGPAFLRSGWFWAGVGVVAAGATTAVLLTRSSDPRPTLGTVTLP
ncbi:tetratricopeptide repeat protein [Pyxidicoccus xibeiensis]|uniref:tetratricopeptide repeat protein n=1 Tax=Pyxidicoccus xibeiensis TaxID=2906759 RepID=UPI0020A7DA1C|nr:tetratricopeptide repeat protein [Pyxidicoccus xibeiensis]MCP3136139.1 tetratricopeptide repeat protein [Pyxidicoccus xibeiensis]